MRRMILAILIVTALVGLVAQVPITIPLTVKEEDIRTKPSNPGVLDVQKVEVYFQNGEVLADVRLTWLQAPVQLRFEPHLTEGGRIQLDLIRTEILSLPLMGWQVDLLDSWLRQDIANSIHEQFEKNGLNEYRVTDIVIENGTATGHIRAPLYRLISVWVQNR